MDPIVATNGGAFVVAWQQTDVIVGGVLEADGSFTKTAEVPGFVPFLRALLPLGDGFVIVFNSRGNSEAVLMDRTGRILGDPRIVLRGYGAYAGSSGSRLLVANEYGEAALLSSDLGVVRSGFRFAPPEVITAYAAVAASPSGFVVAWPQSGSIGITALTPDGLAVKTTALPEPDAIGATISAASDGQRYVIVYRANAEVRVFTTAADGTPLETQRSIATSGTWGSVQLVWAGSEYILIYEAGNAIHRGRLSRDAILTSHDLMMVRGDRRPQSPHIALGWADSVLVWSEFGACAPSYSQVWRLRGGDSRVLSMGFPDNFSPAITIGSGEPLVLWDEIRDVPRIRGAIGEEPLVRTEVSSTVASVYEVASGRSGHLVAYLALDADCNFVIHTTAIDAAGNRGRTTRVSSALDHYRMPTNPNPLAVAWNGSEYLVAWAVPSMGIFGVRVGEDGTVLDEAPVTVTAFADTGLLSPKLAWSVDHWLLVWGRTVYTYIPWGPDPPTVNVISALELDRSLAPRGPAAVITDKGWSPAIATFGSTALIAWRDYSNIYIKTWGSAFVTTITSQRVHNTALEIAIVDGTLYVLDSDILIAVRGSIPRQVLQLDGATAASLASDGHRIALAWTVKGEDGLQRVSVTVFDFARRRTIR